MDLLQTVLQSCGAENFVENFKDNSINTFTLKILSDSDLKLIGIEDEDLRSCIINHISNLQIPTEKNVDVTLNSLYVTLTLITAAVESLQNHIIYLGNSLTRFEKVFVHKDKKKRKKFHVLFPILLTGLSLFLCTKYVTLLK
ncbi:hypothetical protein NQ317_018132 [Molorchus minor]|uniref:SAM domain-containing protein n=1 Tax=Molorchus minor TaxID=1323400 RepID=A0ABQ9IXM1_9CUCU|nr:hypothetical protein NQ317_018132 [Molorchus minor]